MTDNKIPYTPPMVDIVTISCGEGLLSDSGSPSYGYGDNDLGSLT